MRTSLEMSCSGSDGEPALIQGNRREEIRVDSPEGQGTWGEVDTDSSTQVEGGADGRGAAVHCRPTGLSWDLAGEEREVGAISGWASSSGNTNSRGPGCRQDASLSY